ncbi:MULTISPECIES: Rieske (2Fe-2S) protein [unclassified Pseudactinotalea]|uniref:Rieske (2Fe-2S) protein n=1 Tax=unclassified Pseudactinotalea TaxID=2649176 RepID=UPI00128D7E94|nr:MULTISPECIES: Rieske (2Fe-2S) protein [unclassified Pseudactinotalea]MPV49734.1 Rieske 2Fe-2S domain-containing protein [Pseudactinotalea sp. HY160]QGH69592.1 Rieske 2Fe-2S domain-containing protein [Pseudactinotalea sp. HY158]
MSSQVCRRQVLAGAGVIAGVTLLGACSGESTALEPGIVLTPLADVPVGGSVTVTPEGGSPIVVGRPSEGTVVAVSAICTHQGCEVAPIDGEPQVLMCPCHHSEFETFTGDVLEGPAVDPLPEITVAVTGGNVVTA